MAQPGQQQTPEQGVKKPQPSTTRGNTKQLSKLKAGLIQLSLILSFGGLCIEAIWGVGQEVKCAIGVVSDVCYTSGIDWTSQMVVVCGVMCFVAILLLQDTDKVE